MWRWPLGRAGFDARDRFLFSFLRLLALRRLIYHILRFFPRSESVRWLDEHARFSVVDLPPPGAGMRRDELDVAQYNT